MRCWHEATLVDGAEAPHAWRRFRGELPATAAEPEMTVVHARALDADGHAQPRTAAPNERGYGGNGWEDHGASAI